MSDFITELDKYFKSQANYHELQTLGASLSLFQSAIGNTFISQTRDGRRLNAYYIGIGEAGSNKTILTKQLEKACIDLKLQFPNVATPEALVKFIGSADDDPHYEGFIIYDEISRLFRSAKHMENIFITLSQLWSSQRWFYNTVARSMEGFEAGTTISLFGLGTEEVLSHLKKNHFTQGFGRRPFWYVINKTKKKFVEDDFFSENGNKFEIPANIMEFLHFFRGFLFEEFPILWEKSARTLYIKYLNDIEDVQTNLQKEGKNLRRVWLSSSPEFISLLAATMTLSRIYNPKLTRKDYMNTINHKSFFVTENDVKWAYETLQKFFKGFDDIMNLWQISNVVEKKVENIKPLIDKIEAHIVKIISPNLSFSKKKLMSDVEMPQKDFHETFEVMLNRGIITENVGKRTTFYYVNVKDRK